MCDSPHLHFKLDLNFANSSLRLTLQRLVFRITALMCFFRFFGYHTLRM
jgi:hypothetical protein